jgi:hypothetical protein
LISVSENFKVNVFSAAKAVKAITPIPIKMPLIKLFEDFN